MKICTQGLAGANSLYSLDWMSFNQLELMKLGQGNIFTGVCESVHRGGLPQCMLGYPPPPWQGRTPRQGRPPHPWQGRNPWQGRPPWQGRSAPHKADTSLARQTPPCAVHAGRYGQQAGGMHPTGMQFM